MNWEAWGKLVDFFRRKRRSYQQCFGCPAGQAVHTDLAKFCRASESCIVPGDRDLTLIYEGRREVLLHIERYLNYSSEELARIHKAAILNNTGE